MKIVAALVLAAPCVLALACKQPQPEPIPRDTPAESASPAATTARPDRPAAAMGQNPHAGLPGAQATEGGTALAGGPEEIAYEPPATWTSAPNPSPMRKATFKIPKAGNETEDAELAISAASGGVDANVKRWEQQFGDSKAKTEARTVSGLRVTIVEIKGKFAAGGMMGQPAAPKDNQMLLGAIVDAGERQHFFKMTGGEKTVSAARKDFDKLVATFRAK